MFVLLLCPPNLGCLVVFAVLYGASNGVTTILRGTAIAELFGRERYAELNGALSAPAVVAKAVAPLALAGLGQGLEIRKRSSPASSGWFSSVSWVS